MPSGEIAALASSGPSAKPMLPPVAKNAMPLARRAPLAWPATFIASGWKAPTPSPEIPITTSSNA